MYKLTENEIELFNTEVLFRHAMMAGFKVGCSKEESLSILVGALIKMKNKTDDIELNRLMTSTVQPLIVHPQFKGDVERMNANEIVDDAYGESLPEEAGRNIEMLKSGFISAHRGERRSEVVAPPRVKEQQFRDDANAIIDNAESTTKQVDAAIYTLKQLDIDELNRRIAKVRGEK